MALSFGPRRATYFEIGAPADGRGPLSPADLVHFERLDLIYRSLCALLFNYVPTSGHPGGSISSGRFVEAVLFDFRGALFDERIRRVVDSRLRGEHRSRFQ